MTDTILSNDDLFILGNVCARAILSGLGSEAQQILSVLQAERPTNAGSFLMQAVYMFSTGQVQEAKEFLEDSPIFTAEVNSDEAVAFYLVLLKEIGETERAHRLGTMILEEGIFTESAARHAVLKVLNEIEEMSPASRRTVLA